MKPIHEQIDKLLVPESSPVFLGAKSQSEPRLPGSSALAIFATRGRALFIRDRGPAAAQQVRALLIGPDNAAADWPGERAPFGEAGKGPAYCSPGHQGCASNKSLPSGASARGGNWLRPHINTLRMQPRTSRLFQCRGARYRPPFDQRRFRSDADSLDAPRPAERPILATASPASSARNTFERPQVRGDPAIRALRGCRASLDQLDFKP